MEVERKNDEDKQQNKVYTTEFELAPTIKTLIRNIANREGYKTYKIIPKQFCTKGAYYVGELVVIDIIDDAEDNRRETNLFIKQKIHYDLDFFIKMDEVYANELFVYGDLWKVFTKLQEDAAIPKVERFKLAKFKTNEDSTTDVIVLENAMKNGYKSIHRMEVMPLDFAELSVKELAKFHALSFVMKRKMPKYFQDKIKPLRYPVKYNALWKNLISSQLDVTVSLLEGDPCVEKVKSFIKTISDKYDSYLTEATSPSCCLCHGDHRMDNILAKNVDERVTEVLPIDFQLLHYGHPVKDFLYLIFISSDQDFRRKHLTHLKDLYFNTLKKFLMFFSLDVESVYPRANYKDRLDYGLIVALLILPLLFAPEDNLIDLGTTDAKSKSVDPRYKRRIKGVIDDFIEWGYL